MSSIVSRLAVELLHVHSLTAAEVLRVPQAIQTIISLASKSPQGLPQSLPALTLVLGQYLANQQSCTAYKLSTQSKHFSLQRHCKHNLLFVCGRFWWRNYQRTLASSVAVIAKQPLHIGSSVRNGKQPSPSYVL